MDRIYILVVLSLFTLELILGQKLTSEDDKVYLDTLQSEIDGDVTEVQDELIRQAKAVGLAAEKYAKASLTQNIFQALRVMALEELEKVPMQYRIRQPRQEDEGDSGGGDDEDTVESSGGSSDSDVSATTKRTVPLIPVLASILKSVFGGGVNATTPPLNVTHTLQHATKLLFYPLGLPFKSVTSLLKNRRATEPPKTIIKYVPVPVFEPVVTTPAPPTEPTTVRTTTPILRLIGRKRHARSLDSVPPEVIDTDRSSRSRKVPQPKVLYPDIVSNYAPAYLPPLPVQKPKPTEPSTTTRIPPMIYAPYHFQHIPGYIPNHMKPPVTPIPTAKERTEPTVRTPKPKIPQKEMVLPVFAEAVATEPEEKAPAKTSQAPVPVPEVKNPEASTKAVPSIPSITTTTTTSTTTTTTEAPKAGIIYVDSLARDVQNGFDGLVKNLPDILKGAKEAIGLLANIRDIFGEDDDR